LLEAHPAVWNEDIGQEQPAGSLGAFPEFCQPMPTLGQTFSAGTQSKNIPSHDMTSNEGKKVYEV
jgi:hypothetical protein